MTRETWPQPRCGCHFASPFPKVARSSQPWAGGRNPFGIVRARTRFDLIRPIPSHPVFAIQIQIHASTRPSWPPRRFDENDSTAPRLRLQVCRHRVPDPCDHRWAGFLFSCQVGHVEIFHGSCPFRAGISPCMDGLTTGRLPAPGFSTRSRIPSRFP